MVVIELSIVLIFWGGADGFVPQQHLDSFLEFVDVPTQIHVGLLSKQPEVVNTTLVKGYCIGYDVLDKTFCKYYSDCCALSPSRPVEQLPADTFSCHNGYYVIDKCPVTTTDKKLEELCEQDGGQLTDISIRRWPVRGVVSHLLYKNIYCAMCNGVDPYQKVNLADQPLHTGSNNIETSNETLDSVEWLPANVECETDKIRDYVENQPTRDKLLALVKDCNIVYHPPVSPHLCVNAIRTCPELSNFELSELCVKGPANYIKVITTNQIYRNQFCAECYQQNLMNIEPAKLNVEELQPENLQLIWIQSKLSQRTNFITSNYEMLMSARLSLYHNATELKFSSFSSRINVTCSYFADDAYNFCKRDMTNITENSTDSLVSIWNLGSFSCHSPHAKVCDQFIVSNVNSSLDCTEPGCGEGYLLDPETLSCTKVNEFTILQNTQLNNLTWHSDIMCQYLSRCEAVKLGLMKENELNCYCDKFCVYFNDCCEDSDYQATSQTALEHGTFSCIPEVNWNFNVVDGYKMGVMEIDKCPANFENLTVIELCDSPSASLTWSSPNLPVTDIETGLRYSNMYCAMCHKVKNFLFWKLEVGCIEVANDTCTQPIRTDVTSDEFKDNVQMFQMDPGIIQLKRSGLCKTKRFTPPENNSVYRKCRLDANEYVSTCSGSSKDWKISSLCESEPTSFVYEGSSLANLQNSIGSVGTKFHFWDSNVGHSVEYQTFIANRKFRNSYCASCNSVAWQGCHIRETFKADINSSRLFDQYINGEKKYMFIFRIDFNERTCTRDSDAYLVYPNYETGQDTCQNMTALLRQCDCNEVMDLNTLACVTYKNGTTEESCNEVLPNTTIFNLPAYATNQCEENFTYKALPPADAQRECDRCSQQPRGSSNTTECLEVYSFDLFETNAFSIFPTIHCYSRELLHCNLIFPDQKVGCVNDFMGRVTAHGVYHTTVETDVTILNALVIIYSPSTYVFTVLPTTVHGGFDLVFSTYIVETSSYCSTFDIDEAISSRFTVCPDKSIQSVSPPQLKHTDYYLEGEVIKVCAEYELPGFDLQLQDYILSALSITVSIIYIIYYLVRRRWTLTGNLIVSAIATLVGALLFYSLIKEVRNSKVACRVVGSLAQYFLMCTHTWTNSLAIWMIRGITKVQIAATSGKKTYIKFALYSWLTPGVFIALTYVLDRFPVAGLYPVFSPYLCFVEGGWIRVLTFTGFIYALILVNSVLCIIAVYKIVKSDQNLHAADKKRTKKKILTVVKLQIIFGFHWILLFFTEIGGSGPAKRQLWIVLSVFITLQGISVVLSQVIQLESFSKLSRMFLRMKESKGDTSHNTDTAEIHGKTQSSQL